MITKAEIQAYYNATPEEKEMMDLKANLRIAQDSMAIYEESAKRPVGQSAWWYINEGREKFIKKIAELKHQIEGKSQTFLEL